MAIGFKLDNDGDLSIGSDGHIPLLSTFQEAVKQRLQIKFRTFQTEWWLDVTFGIPWLRSANDTGTILGKGLSKPEIDAVLISEARKDPDVLEITNFVSTLNKFTRAYDVNFECVAREGLLRVNIPSLSPSEEVTYPIPSDSGLSPSCNVSPIAWAVDLHPIVHEDLPEALQPPYPWETP